MKTSPGQMMSKQMVPSDRAGLERENADFDQNASAYAQQVEALRTELAGNQSRRRGIY